MKQQNLTMAAVGDISFAGANADNPSIDLFKSVRPVFGVADIVIANLEGPLYDGNLAVPGKCTIRGSTGWAGIFKKAGINIVSLANNHIMDHGIDGLLSTISALERQGIAYVGAGDDKREAQKPIFIEINGCRLAVLARTSVIVDSPSYADEATPGVAFLEMEELLNNVNACRKVADKVVLLQHWGVEHYKFPGPSQRKQARELIEAGVDLIIGHHPHVIQGYESFGRGIVIYSLGNFIFDEFNWKYESADGSVKNFTLSMTPENRKGVMAKFYLSESLPQLKPLFTQIGETGKVALDNDPQRINDFKRLSKRLKNPIYSGWWKLYALKKEWDLRFSRRITLKKLITGVFRLRREHIREIWRTIRNSIRISSGKSTNPYD